MVYRLRADVAAHGHREELEQSMLERAVEEEAHRWVELIMCSQGCSCLYFIFNIDNLSLKGPISKIKVAFSSSK